MVRFVHVFHFLSCPMLTANLHGAVKVEGVTQPVVRRPSILKLLRAERVSRCADEQKRRSGLRMLRGETARSLT